MNWKKYWVNRDESNPLKEHGYGSSPEIRKWFTTRCTRVAAALKLNKKTTFLDAGCGNGEMLKELITRGFLAEQNCAGVDVSKRLLAKARKKLPLASFECVELGVQPLSFEDKRFDSSLCFSVTHYLRLVEVEAMVNELLRVSKNFVLVGDVASSKEFFKVHPLWGFLAYPLRGFYGGSVNYIEPSFFQRFNVLSVVENGVRFNVLLGVAGKDEEEGGEKKA